MNKDNAKKSETNFGRAW